MHVVRSCCIILQKIYFPSFLKKNLCINFTRWPSGFHLFTRSKRTKQLVCSARTRPWRLLEPLKVGKTRSRLLRWFRPGGASRRTSEGRFLTQKLHIVTSRIYGCDILWHFPKWEIIPNYEHYLMSLKSRFGFRGVPTWPLLFYLHTSKAWQAQQLAEENKELFKTAGRHRMCTPDAANSYPQPFNCPLHTLSYPLHCTINRSIFALFGWMVEILWNL